MLAVDAPEAIARSFGRLLLAVHAADRYHALRALRDYGHTHTVYPFGESLHYTDASADAPAGQIATDLGAGLETHGVHDARIDPIPATVEDVFMERMGGPGA